MVPLQLKYILGLMVKEMGISSHFHVSISSRYDLSCRKQRKNQFSSFPHTWRDLETMIMSSI